MAGAASPSCTGTSRTVPGGAGPWGPGELWVWGVPGAELGSRASPGMPVPPPAGCFLGYCLPSGIFPSGKGIMQLHRAGAKDLLASMASEASHASSALNLAHAGCLTCGTVRASLQALAGGNGPAVWRHSPSASFPPPWASPGLAGASKESRSNGGLTGPQQWPLVWGWGTPSPFPAVRGPTPAHPWCSVLGQSRSQG